MIFSFGRLKIVVYEKKAPNVKDQSGEKVIALCLKPPNTEGKGIYQDWRFSKNILPKKIRIQAVTTLAAERKIMIKEGSRVQLN